MHVFDAKSSMRGFSREQRAVGMRIGFVPTMGFLHEGHLSLVRAAKAVCDVVVVSIYVNPTQFSKDEDFGTYPSSLDEDVEKLRDVGCDALLLPSKSLYSYGNDESRDDGSMVVGQGGDQQRDAHDSSQHSTWVDVEGVSEGLCSMSRPHFFRGVATIVSKLFNIVEPDVAFFGKKDYQQFKVITRLVRDLDFDIEIIGVDIEREGDGLARSSRNALLSPENRAASPVVYRALLKAQRDCRAADESLRVDQVTEEIAKAIASEGGRVDYVQVVDRDSLSPLEDAVLVGSSLIAVAAFFGQVRLIDNVEV
jgi:pantoate--beta-alanine ligase